MMTNIVRHIFRMPRPTNFKLGIRIEDDDPHQPEAHDLQGQTLRSQGHVISLRRLGPMSLVAGGGIPCRPNPTATLLVINSEVTSSEVSRPTLMQIAYRQINSAVIFFRRPVTLRSYRYTRQGAAPCNWVGGDTSFLSELSLCIEQAAKRVPLKLEQQLTIVKLQMFHDYFNEADEERKGGVTMTQFRRAVRDTIGDHVTDDDADMVFMKVDTFNTGIVLWEVRSSHVCLILS